MRTISLAFLALLSTVATLTVTPTARGEEWNKETIVNFRSPVEVPGKILPPGTYIFRLAGSPSDRQLVQIFTQDRREIVALVQAIPAYHIQPADKPVISFAERPAGQPEALQSWFYPGDNYGVEFVYPNSAVEPRAKAVQQLASNADPVTEIPPLVQDVAPLEAELITPTSPVVPVLAQAQEETQVLAENDVPKPEARLTKLPKTAGNFLILPLLGLLLLICGSAIMYTVEQRT